MTEQADTPNDPSAGETGESSAWAPPPGEQATTDQPAAVEPDPIPEPPTTPAEPPPAVESPGAVEATPPPEPAVAAGPPPPGFEQSYSPNAGGSAGSDRPEVAIGAAFAGGFLLAMILRRLAR